MAAGAVGGAGHPYFGNNGVFSRMAEQMSQAVRDTFFEMERGHLSQRSMRNWKVVCTIAQVALVVAGTLRAAKALTLLVHGVGTALLIGSVSGLIWGAASVAFSAAVATYCFDRVIMLNNAKARYLTPDQRGFFEGVRDGIAGIFRIPSEEEIAAQEHLRLAGVYRMLGVFAASPREREELAQAVAVHAGIALVNQGIAEHDRLMEGTIYRNYIEPWAQRHDVRWLRFFL